MLYIATLCAFIIALVSFQSAVNVGREGVEAEFGTVIAFLIYVFPFGYLACQVVDRLLA